LRGDFAERALILAPGGRDASLARDVLAEAGMKSTICADLSELLNGLDEGAAFSIITEETLLRANLHGFSEWIRSQPEWSDFPFVLLTRRGGGLERNPEAVRLLSMLGNVTFLERPFHPTTLVSLARSALRGRRRQYDARARLLDLRRSEDELRRANETLEARVEERTRKHDQALAQLHEAQKLETLGQLTGGVAHDFNNLLTPVIGNLDLLRRKLADDPRASRLVESALQAASRAATLVQRLLAFSRRQDLQPRSVSISSLLEGMTDMISRSLGPTIDVEMVIPPDLPAARVDPNQLELALLNLAVNARDAMPGGGRLRIVASRTTAASPRIQPGDYVRIAVSDTGIGMDPLTLTRAIEPFYTTKGVGKGTGLGLSMVHGLAAQLGGMLDLQSTAGEGTTAEIWLPISDAAADTAEPERLDPARPVRCASILLVDDEELVRSATMDMMQSLGYKVIEAASGSEALRLLQSGIDIDLLVTDYLMPAMNGVDLAVQVQRIAPKLPVLLITGYSTMSEGPGVRLARLAKPFRQVDLADKLAALLNPSPKALPLALISSDSSNGAGAD
jgi:signal transduction histidine kinase